VPVYQQAARNEMLWWRAKYSLSNVEGMLQWVGGRVRRRLQCE